MGTALAIEDTDLAGAKIITPFFVEDERGYFLKCFEKDVFRQFGLDTDIYEDFESFSTRSVVRGLHFQTRNPQAKLVRVIQGSIIDVIVDVRDCSENFGKWELFALSDENRKQLWIPKGFAHGFCVRSDHAIVSYKCMGKYEKDYDSGIVWNDPDLAIPWNVANPIISVRDSNLMTISGYKALLEKQRVEQDGAHV